MAFLFALAPEGACQAAVLPRRWWSLTPPFQLFSHPPKAGSGSLLFCGANPSGRPAWPLTSFLPCGARTFLTPTVRDGGSRDRLARFARRYCTTSRGSRAPRPRLHIIRAHTVLGSREGPTGPFGSCGNCARTMCRRGRGARQSARCGTYGGLNLTYEGTMLYDALVKRGGLGGELFHGSRGR